MEPQVPQSIIGISSRNHVNSIPEQVRLGPRRLPFNDEANSAPASDGSYDAEIAKDESLIGSRQHAIQNDDINMAALVTDYSGDVDQNPFNCYWPDLWETDWGHWVRDPAFDPDVMSQQIHNSAISFANGTAAESMGGPLNRHLSIGDDQTASLAHQTDVVTPIVDSTTGNGQINFDSDISMRNCPDDGLRQKLSESLQPRVQHGALASATFLVSRLMLPCSYFKLHLLNKLSRIIVYARISGISIPYSRSSILLHFNLRSRMRSFFYRCVLSVVSASDRQRLLRMAPVCLTA